MFRGIICRPRNASGLPTKPGTDGTDSEATVSSSPSNPFTTVLAALDSEGVRYLVISGQAGLHYGAIEATRDADLWDVR